jgi:hypothetical protein
MVPTADLDSSINSGLRAMAADYDWPWLQVEGSLVTVANQSTYATSGLTGWVRTLWIQDDARDLEYRQRREVTRYKLNTGPRAFIYTISADQIVLAPTPTEVRTLTHAYIRTEPPLVNGSDAIVCPDHFSDLAVLYATIEEATRLKDTALRNLLISDKNEWIGRLRDNVRRSSATVRLRSRNDWAM